MKWLVLRLLSAYKRIYPIRSFIMRVLTGQAGIECRFTPSCSEYTYSAVMKYGVVKGLFLGARRILRCHPRSKGGYDPVS